MSFDTFGLHAAVLAGVRDMQYERPTPIQMQGIPAALPGRDLLACAATGSGKTAAFLLPLLHRLMDRPRGATRALVLSPTRELAMQIHENLEALAKHTGIRGAAVFGGVGMKPQEMAFRRGTEVIVATPGRLLDHLQHDYARLDQVEILVLDEADRMLDMGFLPDIRRVLKHVPAKRQTLLFSATLPAPIVQIAREMMQDPASVNVERKSGPAATITQALYPVPEDLKPALFLELLRRGDVGNVIVFCRTKHRANRLAEILEAAKVPSARIHGNRSQTARTDALEGFKAGRYRVLVATDIVARGIDVEALEHVVNFDVPVQPEHYIHRVGRTGRAEATGDAYTLVSPEEERELKAIERAVGKPIPRVIVPGFDYKAKAAERFEVPIQVRIAEIRKRKAEDRERSRQKAERKAQREAEETQRRTTKDSRGSRPAQPSARRDDGPRPAGGSPQGGGERPDGQGGGGGRRRNRGRRRGGRSGAPV